MIDNTELKILDEILKTLSISDSVKWFEIMNETLDRCEFLKDVDHFTFQVALLKLVKDDYVIETNKDIDNPKKTHYNISFEGLFFIKNGGYENQNLKSHQVEMEVVEMKKMQSLLEAKNASLQVQLVVLTYLIAFGTLVAAIYYLLEVLAFLGVCQSKKI
ncbi:hypothetical protein [Flavobacterium undicola]|uniref:hypothetical protein n=1 Tax=Flavobacterium undicola TaxID=1932779 RepID=UPI0013774DFE|nr:hypothetical protein [Flavobacterium undicola]MBA0883599.1 hypothetical protein [Flavobacterium undicola]